MWITDLDVKYKTKKLQEDKFRRNPKWRWVWWYLLRYNSKTQSMRGVRISQISLKLKPSALQKTVSRKWKATKWDKIFANDRFDKGLLSKVYKELLNLNNEETNSIKTWSKHLNQSYKGRKHMKRCSTSYVIK